LRAGASVLKNTANTLKHNLRGSDLCGRWGGEEFIVIVFEVDQAVLESVADKLRSLVETSVISAQGQDLHVTVSIGATLVTKDDTLETLIHRAVSLMYRSKSEGRNRVSCG
jgi:diguanylate cyclase (GGDEF)-like protein